MYDRISAYMIIYVLGLHELVIAASCFKNILYLKTETWMRDYQQTKVNDDTQHWTRMIFFGNKPFKGLVDLFWP